LNKTTKLLRNEESPAANLNTVAAQAVASQLRIRKTMRLGSRPTMVAASEASAQLVLAVHSGVMDRHGGVSAPPNRDSSLEIVPPGCEYGCE
jgi:hypothetical protein